ncbi:MAG: hypothetical protein P8I91_06555 [Phycisphaerales bacterium]|nr:hypothetical protein [Phycisphaerales bacterium]
MLKHCILIGSAITAGLWAVPTASAGSDAIVLYSAGMDGMLDDSKDAGLHAALLLMEKHGLSLPPDISSTDALGINTVVNMLLSQNELRLRVDPSLAKQGQPPFALTMSSGGNAGWSVDAIETRMDSILQDARVSKSKTDPDNPSLKTFQPGHNAPQIWYGVESDQFMVGINGAPETSEVDWSGCDLPTGVDPLLGMMIDFNQMQPLMEMAPMMVPNAAGMLKSFGLVGPDAIKLEFGIGRGSDRMHLGGRITNYGKHFGDDLVAGGIRPADLTVLPQDTVSAQITRFQLSSFLNNMLEMVGSMASPIGAASDKESASPLEQARSMSKMMLGIDPMTELIDYLGDTMAYYRSQSTGGGGLMSTVLLVELSNADGMATTLGTLSSRINAMASPMTEGYVQFSNWSDPDCGEVIALVFPGIPVPIELSMVVKGDWLVTTLTPQAMIAACQQLDSKKSIADNPRFASSIGNKALGAVQVSFDDGPAQLSEGYGMMAGLMTAVSNYTRPRTAAKSGVVMTLPTYNELAKGARPCALVVRSMGNDLVYTGTCDSSMNVLMTSAVANLSSMLPLVAPAAIGMALPAIESAREAARYAEERQRRRLSEHEDSRHEENKNQENEHGKDGK